MKEDSYCKMGMHLSYLLWNWKGMVKSMKDRECILAFDRELACLDDYRMVISKLLYYIMGIVGCMSMAIPLSKEDKVSILMVFPFLFWGMSVLFRMGPYIFINNTLKIETILTYIPVDKIELFYVRRGYLRKYLAKIGIIILILQQVGAIIEGCWSVWNLFFPAAIIIVLYWIGLGYIRVNTVKRRQRKQ